MYTQTGHCGKCGAPYYVNNYNWSILPPSPTPTCACWNTIKTVITTHTNTLNDKYSDKND